MNKFLKVIKNILNITFKKVITFFGMHRIPAFCCINEDGLSKEKID